MQNIKKQNLPKSLIEIEGEVLAEDFEGYYNEALKHLGEHIEIDGFRKGKAPENLLLKNIPEIKILEEMAELALRDHYPKILEKHEIDAIGRPEITVTKLARNNPLGYKIKTAVLPVVNLPDYKKIAKDIGSSAKEEEKNVEVTNEEIEKTIEDILKSRAPKEDPEKIPELNDDFVKALGPFENVEDFKTKLKDNLKLEKENAVKERVRLKIIEGIINATPIEIPDLLIEAEADKILYKMEADITAMGLKFEDYLKHINKTKEDLRNEWKPDGEKKAKFSLVLHEIGKAENIKADEQSVEKEVSLIMEHYKDADPARARAHAEGVLTNEKIFEFLESLS